jgi:hypothetical protein
MTTLYVNPIAGEKFAVQPSFDGGATYNAAVVFNTTKALTFSVSTNATEIADLNNLSNAAVTYRSVKAQDFKVDGSGTLEANAVSQYTTLMINPQPIPAKIVIQMPPGSGANALTYTTTLVMESFALTAPRADKATVSVTMTQAGPITGPVVS